MTGSEPATSGGRQPPALGPALLLGRTGAGSHPGPSPHTPREGPLLRLLGPSPPSGRVEEPRRKKSGRPQRAPVWSETDPYLAPARPDPNPRSGGPRRGRLAEGGGGGVFEAHGQGSRTPPHPPPPGPKIGRTGAGGEDLTRTGGGLRVRCRGRCRDRGRGAA